MSLCYAGDDKCSKSLYGEAFLPPENSWPYSCEAASFCRSFVCGPPAGQAVKKDEGKLQLALVPTQIIRDIAQVRMFGLEKYADPENWKLVEIGRYVNALYRHFLEFLDNPRAVDKESGLEAYKHMACNMAFICALMAQEEKE